MDRFTNSKTSAANKNYGNLPVAFIYRNFLAVTVPSRIFDLYNLYHMLNHLNLFGTAYLGEVNRIVGRYV